MDKKEFYYVYLKTLLDGKNRRDLGGVVVGIWILLLGFALPGWGAISDTTADIVIGQVAFNRGTDNLVDAKGFNLPFGVAIDRSVNPNRLYVTDSKNHRILGYRDISSFVNGNPADLVIGQPDFFSSGCNSSGLGPGSLCTPLGIIVDNAGNLYVADSDNNRVLEYDSPFTTDTLADRVFGQGGSFSSNTCNNGGIQAGSLCGPQGIYISNAGILYISDSKNNRVLEYNNPLTSQVANRVFGQGGNFASNACNNGGVAGNSLCLPVGIVVDQAGNIYIVDTNNNRVLEFDNPQSADPVADRVFGQNGSFGSNVCNNGGTSQNSLCFPQDAKIDPNGNLYIVDTNNHRVLEFDNPLTSDTQADRVFGQGGNFNTNTCNSGGVTAASLCTPIGVTFDSSGNAYVSDFSNNRILMYQTPLTSDTIADKVFGQKLFTTFFPDFTDAQGLFDPFGVAIDRSVIPNRLYVTDTTNSRILGYKDVLSLINGKPADLVIGQPDFFSAGCNTGGISASSLCLPIGIAVDSNGNLYVADFNNNRILEYNSPFTTDTIADKVFGQGGDFTTNACNKGGLSANSLCIPLGVAVDKLGNLYVSDSNNHRVLEFDNPLTSDTQADRVFGQGGSFTTNTCNNGGIHAGSLCSPWELAVDNLGNLLVTDRDNHRVLEFDNPLTSDTQADRVFGQGGSFTTNTCNTGGRSANSLCSPQGVTWDNFGNVYIADAGNHRVLLFMSPLTTDQVADLVLGQGGNFTTALANNGGISANSFFTPVGLGVDDFGRLYVADNDNNRILVFFPPPPSVTTLTPSVVIPGIRSQTVLSGADFQAAMTVDFGPGFTIHSLTGLPNNQLLIDFTPGISISPGSRNVTLNALDGQSSTLANGLMVIRNPSIVDSSDFDRDNKLDLAVWRPSEGRWYIQNSFLGLTFLDWGLEGDVPVPGDYDGDKRTDLAVWRPSDGTWYIFGSRGGFNFIPWGVGGDIPVPRDYDGDQKTDLAVWRPSDGTWYIFGSRGGFNFVTWGVEGDIPVPGDYDGDGVIDVGVWRPSDQTWYILLSQFGFLIQKFGQPGDIPVAADYDGNGITNLAVWRPTDGTWEILAGNRTIPKVWGLPGDVPVPADYDGDKRVDLAIWRPQNGNWEILTSSSRFTKSSSIQWGFPGDIPVSGTRE
ncbi:MAG TPA: hypothetical protein VNM22_12025 [Candidatus Limnocylindrales bacterium]|nr:hypothetical protein [Candidatus Limnocylindrales bacterium]